MMQQEDASVAIAQGRNLYRTHALPITHTFSHAHLITRTPTQLHTPSHPTQLSQAVAFLIPSCFLLLLVNIAAPSPNLAMVLISMALAANSASHSGYWANIIDLAPAHAGFVCGVSNTIATLPGANAPMHAHTAATF